MTEGTRRFTSKVDWWIAIALVSAPLIAGVAAVPVTFTGEPGATVVAWATVGFVLVLYAAVGWPLYYEVSDDTLLVRSGLLRRRIPLDEITRIQPSRNPLSSPALSLDRLRIERRNGRSLLISPADRTGFVLAIVKRAPKVVVDRDLVCGLGGQWSALAPGTVADDPAAERRRRLAEGPTEAVKDGRAWRIGGPDEVAWIAEGTAKHGVSMSVAIPPVFEAFATFYPAGNPPVPTMVHERAVVRHLVAHTPEQPWWLGFLDTGAHDIVFDDAPMVSLYFQWNYVLVEAGPEEALTWRTGHMRAGDGSLPDLFFPADRSWLVSGLWDDGWTCIGGPADLIEALHNDPDVAARIIGPDDDRKPPGLPRY